MIQGPFSPNALPMMQPEGVARQNTATPTPETSEGEATNLSTDFSEQLSEFVERVDAEQKVAESQATAFAEGKNNDLHGTMISLQRADISLRLAANVRNRALEAYREIMRMGA